MSEDNSDKKLAALGKLRAMRNADGPKPARPDAGNDAAGGGGNKGEALKRFLANRKDGGGGAAGGMGGGAGGGKFREMMKARGGMGGAAAGGAGGLRDRLAGGAGGAEGGGKRALLKKIMENRKGGAMGTAAAAPGEKVDVQNPTEQRAMLRERIAKLQAKLDQLDIDGTDEDLE